jgi:hypothetical protein
VDAISNKLRGVDINELKASVDEIFDKLNGIDKIYKGDFSKRLETWNME